MKRCMLALALGLLVTSSSGCCLFDKLFGHGVCGACCGGPYPGNCGPTGCGPASGPGCGSACGQTGCSQGRCCGSPACAHGCCCGLGCNDGGATEGMDDGSAYAGPPTGAVAYPYYTTHGPRDFLANNPRGLGPN